MLISRREQNDIVSHIIQVREGLDNVQRYKFHVVDRDHLVAVTENTLREIYAGQHFDHRGALEGIYTSYSIFSFSSRESAFKFILQFGGEYIFILDTHSE